MSIKPVTGRGLAMGEENTALAADTAPGPLNEVGRARQNGGIAPADFHSYNQGRLNRWPHTLLATSTHDSKRSEDTRARINVLSEIPAEWYKAIRLWKALNRKHKPDIGNGEVPSPADEYFFYENLVGIWPMHEPSSEQHVELTGRMKQYMRKALREAKIHTSWINPNVAYEEAVDQFEIGRASCRERV